MKRKRKERPSSKSHFYNDAMIRQEKYSKNVLIKENIGIKPQFDINSNHSRLKSLKYLKQIDLLDKVQFDRRNHS